MSYKRLLGEFRELDKFLKDQLMIRLVITYIWSVIAPIIMKLQGLHWSTTLIAIYLIFSRSSGIFVPLFRWLSLKRAYKSLIVLDCIYVFMTLTYFIDVNIFLYGEALLAVLFPILVEIFYINYTVHLIEKYGKEKYENMSYLGSTTIAVGSSLGFFTVVLSDTLLANESHSILLFCTLFLFVLILQVYNYKTHYKNMID